MGSILLGDKLRVSIFGQSHGEAVGVVLDGFPAGFPINFDGLRAFLARRAPGGAAYATARKEPDLPRFVSGVVDGVTCGAPLCALIENTDTRSPDYENLSDTPRPGHADYTARVKFGGAEDARGGGHFSGRLTAALCVAGGLALQYLESRGARVGAHIAEVAGIADDPFPDCDPERINSLFTRDPFPVLNREAGEAMRGAIEDARREGDSVGGVVECAVTGLPAGLGDPLFGGVENRVAAAVFGIPAVKGIEFGSGFRGSGMRGSENNDPFSVKDGRVVTLTNNHGGILGGITSGMPVVFRAAFKPTPSIAKEQLTANLATGEREPLRVRGRHDPCVVPRAVPCVEAAAGLVFCDLMLSGI